MRVKGKEKMTQCRSSVAELKFANASFGPLVGRGKDGMDFGPHASKSESEGTFLLARRQIHNKQKPASQGVGARVWEK